MPPKKSAKGAKGKMEVKLHLPEGGEPITVDSCTAADTVAQLKVAVQKALDELEAKAREGNSDDASNEGLPDISEETREERSKLIGLTYMDKELDNPEEA